MYFWYSRGMPSVDRFVSSGSRMYQFDTSSMPSGLTSVQRMMSSFRIRIVSGSVLRVQPVDRFDQLLRAEHFGRVQAAVDPDDGLAVLRELARLLVGEAVGERQPAVDVLVAARASCGSPAT